MNPITLLRILFALFRDERRRPVRPPRDRLQPILVERRLRLCQVKRREERNAQQTHERD